MLLAHWDAGGPEVQWFYEMEIPSITADNIGCEQGFNRKLNGLGVLHAALLCNLGGIFNEIVWLKDLAEDCDKDKQYTFPWLVPRSSSFTAAGRR